MGDLEKFRADRIAEAKRRLADAVPEATDSIIELARDAKAEPVRLQAARAILDQNATYAKEDAEKADAELGDFIDQQIIYLFKEWSRKEVFMKMLKQLGEGASPDDIIQLREETDAIFGINVIEAEAVELESGEEEE